MHFCMMHRRLRPRVGPLLRSNGFKSGAFELGLAWAHCPQDGDKEATQGRPGCVGGPAYDDSPGRKGGSIAWYWGAQVMAVLSSWMSAAGCLRYRHLLRSVPRKLTKSTMHCLCKKGKQRRLRSGFSFCLPASFSTGWPWGQHWLTAFRRLDDKTQQTCGLTFDATGAPWHIKEMTEAVCRPGRGP